MFCLKKAVDMQRVYYNRRWEQTQMSEFSSHRRSKTWQSCILKYQSITDIDYHIGVQVFGRTGWITPIHL